MGIVTFEKLKLEEVEALAGMIEDVISNTNKIRGYSHNIRFLEKKLGTSEETHYVVTRDIMNDIKFKYPGQTKSYMYEICKRNLEKEIFNNKFEAYLTINDLPFLTKKSISKSKIAKVCNEFITLKALAIEHNRDILYGVLTTLIRKCDNYLAIMLLEDHIDDIIGILTAIIEDISLEIYSSMELLVTNECMNRRLGKDVIELLIRFFNAYRIFKDIIHDKLLKGLKKYLESGCSYLIEGGM